jgi:hypothetical protein
MKEQSGQQERLGEDWAAAELREIRSSSVVFSRTTSSP